MLWLFTLRQVSRHTIPDPAFTHIKQLIRAATTQQVQADLIARQIVKHPVHGHPARPVEAQQIIDTVVAVNRAVWRSAGDVTGQCLRG